MMRKTKNKKQKTKNKGFSLMEVIIAIAIITTALISIMVLITFSISSIRVAKSKIIATNLAQEGLEIVRNIRDSNWLSYKRASENWRDGLQPGDYRVQYNQLGLLSFSALPLRKNSNGFYQYDSGNNTPFYRKITIEHVADNQIKVKVEVNWQERGKNQIIQAEDRLYNWLEEQEEEE